MRSIIEFMTGNKPATPLQAAVVVAVFFSVVCFNLWLVFCSTKNKSNGKEA